ncbi:MAG: response regulator [Pirellulaceae bacterium]
MDSQLTIPLETSKIGSPENYRLLIVDDEPNIRAGLAKGLSNDAQLIDTASTAEAALALFVDGGHHLVIADVRLGCDIDGIELIKQMLAIRPRTTVVSLPRMAR